MRELMSAIGRIRLGVPLWAVAACGILAGAIVAQESRTSHAAEPPPVIAPVAPARPSGITFLDSPRNAEPAAAPAPGTSAAANAAGPAAPPHAASSGGFERIGIMLVILIGGVVALAFWKRKKERPSKLSNQLAVLGQVRVAGRWSVALVRVPGKTLVLGATDKGLSLLSSIDDSDPTLDEAEARAALESQDPIDPLSHLIAEQEPVAAMRAAPPRPPLPTTSTEPFSRLLDQLTAAGGSLGANDLSGPAAPRQSRPSSYGPGSHASHGSATRAAAPSQANPPSAAPGPRAERMLTPQADALRARLERFTTPTA
ncbi:MAG: flagellar biosynthetic protein FliO [Myxococcota bacterium]